MTPRHHEREQRKYNGWNLAYDESADPGDRAYGLLMVIEAHYDRSREGWRGGKHGTLEQYVASWLVANGDRYPELAPVVAYLQRLFPRPKRPRIAYGSSYWGTAGKRDKHGT